MAAASRSTTRPDEGDDEGPRRPRRRRTPAPRPRAFGPARVDPECSEKRSGCIVGGALRGGTPVETALAEAFEKILYQGIRPSAPPITRGEAVEKLLAAHCARHRAMAEASLASLSPGLGIPRRQPPPSTDSSESPPR